MPDSDWYPVDDLRNQLDTAEYALLTARGWHATSSTPDSVWLWTKTWKDKTIMVSKSHALAMERSAIWDA